MSRIVVIGAGGHAKVVIDAARAAGHDVVALVDEAGSTNTLMGIETTPVVPSDGFDGFVVAIGDNARRSERFKHYRARGFEPVSVIHPAAVIAPSAIVGAGVVILAGVVVNADASIGDDAILNTGCTVDHDCSIGAHAHVAPGANLCGGVTVGSGALVGVGTCAIPGVRIGARSVVGAGAAVTSDVPDETTVAGVPARPLTELS